MIDTHCHLSSSRFKKDRAETIARARKAGVSHFLEVGYDLVTSERSQRLAGSEPDMWSTVGVHPHEVAKTPEDSITRLRELAAAPRVVAIGEIGLDFYRNLSPAKLQRQWFSRQLELARELELPVVIHTRDAMDEMLHTLAGASLSKQGVLHCYSGDAKQAIRAVDLGFRLGFGGTLTYGIRDLEEAARVVPREAVVLETDSPYLIPEPKDTRRNEPALLTRVRRRLAEIRGESEEDVDAFTTQNAIRLFALTAG